MKKIFALACLLTLSLLVHASNVSYTPDNTSIFPNPERGYYVEFDQKVGEDGIYTCVKHRATELNEDYVTPDNLSLVLVLYYLDYFKDTDVLPNEVFEGFEEDMQTLRDMGLKCILRFAYTDDNSGEIGYDAPLSRVEKHIGQYKRHWEANADVIYCFQAGFIGAWGEWYYSSNFGNQENQMNASRRALIDTLLNAVPQDRYIQIRTPLYKTGYIGDTNPLTKEEAYSGSPRARLGHHNDAFLYGEKNQGTYTDTATQKPYIAQETLYVPLGGETDITSKKDAREWATYDKTIAEMSRMHWTFIQGYYSQTVTNLWRENGTFDELNRRMGYRYQLVSGSYSDKVEQDKQMSIRMQIRNAGFAPLYNERQAYIVLRAQTASLTEYRIQISADPRTWLPNGEISEIEEEVTIPSSIPTGTYHLYLWMPDLSGSLASDPRYAIRFANENVWNGEKGWNDLGAEITVTDPVIPVDPDAPIVLPATLDKSNYYATSNDITWYNEDYFDFGSEDGENLDRWVKWKVELKYPGEYTIFEVFDTPAAPDGYEWNLTLLDAEDDEVSSYNTTRDWGGDRERVESVKWNLSNVQSGIYTLRVKNAFDWAQPKLKSLTLEYDDEIPTEVERVNDAEKVQLYDLLGRPVDAGYKGIVVMRGKKIVITQ